MVRYNRPLTDFDKELAQLIESNKPVNYQAGPQQQFGGPQFAIPQQPQLRPGPKHRPSQIQEQRYVSATNEPVYIQPQQRIKYVNPANIQYVQKQQQGIPQGPPKSQHEVPAQRYQFISVPQQQQQYHPQSQLQLQQQQQDLSQVQYYVPREKEILTQQADNGQQQQQQQQVVYDTQGVMKIVDPPQLQYAQPEAQKLVAEQPQKYQPSKKQSQKESQQTGHSHKSSTPSRSAIYVSRTTGGPPLPKNDKPDLPPLKLNNDRPLTQAEFQALIDQGYNVVPVPVPVPYPVTYDPQTGEEKPVQQEPQPSQSRYAAQASRPRHHAPAYRYANQHTSASQQRPVTYLQPVSQDEAYTGIRGPNAAAA